MEVTKSAAQAIRDVVAEAGEDVAGLRIVVSASGCSGIRYNMSLDTAADADDDIIDCNGAKVLLDPDSHRLLDGATIDFRDDMPEAGFVFDNPNAQGLCSCAGGTCSESEGVQ